MESKSDCISAAESMDAESGYQRATAQVPWAKDDVNGFTSLTRDRKSGVIAGTADVMIYMDVESYCTGAALMVANTSKR